MSGVSGGGVPPASSATGGDVLPTSGVSGVGVTGASGARQDSQSVLEYYGRVPFQKLVSKLGVLDLHSPA
ncbi:unnamed protein product [Microthlaspi erraticum]|uniref:Uncharacterized protein n=1 Tax=Microthlaspi erraticum TaxID=1685480 RepID=A0A6D2I2R3_9BRAS|nr:unnamed protein product [Microthlaspi erraticum]